MSQKLPEMTHLPYFKALLALLCILLLGNCGRQAPAESAAAPSLESLHRALDAFNKAYARADGEALDKMLTAAYLHTNGANPPLDKSGWLKYVAGRKKALDAGSLAIDHYALHDIKARLYGNAAAVSGKVRISGLGEGGPFDHEYQVTQLWVFEPGGWKRAAFHDGQIR